MRRFRGLPEVALVPMVAMHHGVALPARDEPAVDRQRDRTGDQQGGAEAPPEQRGVEAGRHGAGHEEQEEVAHGYARARQAPRAPYSGSVADRRRDGKILMYSLTGKGGALMAACVPVPA